MSDIPMSSLRSRILSILFSSMMLSLAPCISAKLPLLCNMSGCTCNITTKGYVTSLNCNDIGLTTIPDLNNFSNITAIRLSGNGITVIKSGDFDPVRDKLISLTLSNNKIHTIEEDAFVDMRRLKTIILSNNFLKSFPEDAFTNAEEVYKTTIDTLDLSHNRLSAIPHGLVSVRKYTTLLLNDNPMGNLENGSFDGRLNEVDHLDISNLGMTEFVASNLGFAGIKIYDLYLDQNHFVEVNQDMFSGLEKTQLRTLSLRFCGIRNIRKASFKGATKLRTLLMDGNEYEVLKAKPFRDLTLNLLDLENSTITDIRKTAFQNLDVTNLYLGYNNIGVIHPSEFKGITGVKFLDLTDCNIVELRGSPFNVLNELTELHLLNNHLTDASMEIGLYGMPKLEMIVLAGNRLTRVPRLNATTSPRLKDMRVNHNYISSVSRDDLRMMDSLEFLDLSRNPLRGFGETLDDTFAECPHLDGLDMDHTEISSFPNMTYLPKLRNLHADFANLTSIPEDLCCSCSDLTILELSHNRITSLPTLSCRKLFDLDVSNNQIRSLHPKLLLDMKYLNRLDLENNLISEIDHNFFANSIGLKYLTLSHNELTKLPSLSEMPHLARFDASYNKIRRIERGSFVSQILMADLFLNNNQLDFMDPEAFSTNSDLKRLNLSDNPNFREWVLPQGGFPYLAVLSLEGLPNLHQVPHTFQLQRAKELHFTYSYHCCIWDRYITPPEPVANIFIDEEGGDISVEITKATDPPPTSLPTATNCSTLEQFKKDFEELYPGLCVVIEGCVIKVIKKNIAGGNITDGTDSEILGDGRERVFTMYTSVGGINIFVEYTENVTCVPHENPLTPCQNLMDPWVLRVAIWAIWVLALLGNGTVLFIGIATKGKLEANDLLICNLAFADFCMGVYLAFLAVVDVRTFTVTESTFYQSALDWQLGPGCKTAGFIAVFSTELSIFILVVLTLERVYTISRAFDKNEERKRKVAIGMCVVGWFWAAGLAILPVFGINSYDRVAVCLPYVTEKWWDRFYIGFILTLNFVGFLVILVSYAYIFVNACRVSPAGHIKQRRKDILSAVSKIAVLILTALLCWAPIAIIGYLALVNVHLVDASQAKYFIVFVYPLNACVNPFIYVIFTRSFRNKFSAIFQRSKDRVTSFPLNDPRRRQSHVAFAPEYPMNEMHSSGGGGGGGEELMKLRQSRRSNSLVVQFVDSNLTTPSPTFNPPIGCNFGRRASLPPGFGSTLNSLNTIGSSSRENSHSHLPHYSLPFRLGSVYSSNNSSLPNLQEESDLDLETEVLQSVCSDSEEPRTCALTSSQESNLRRLSVVEEESEGDGLGIFYPYEGTGGECAREDESASVSSSEDYTDASDSLPLDGEERGTDLDFMMMRNVVFSTAEVSLHNTPTSTCSSAGDLESRDSAYTSIRNDGPPGLHSKSFSCEDMRLLTNEFHLDISSHVVFPSIVKGKMKNVEQFMISHNSSKTGMKKSFSISDFLVGRGADSGDEGGENGSIVHKTDGSRSHTHILSTSEQDKPVCRHQDDVRKKTSPKVVCADVPKNIIVETELHCNIEEHAQCNNNKHCSNHSNCQCSHCLSVPLEISHTSSSGTIQARINKPSLTSRLVKMSIETDV